MKAWRLGAYGEGGDPAKAIAALKLEEVAVPTPGKGEVRVRVEFASINPIDWKVMSGGLHAACPCVFPYTPGFDVSGSIDAVGDGVTEFKVGDGVIADTGLTETCCTPAPAAGNCGAFADYAVVPANLCSSRGSASAETLAGLPLVALTSYQAMYTGSGRSFTGERLGDLKKGDKLLVLGGSSSVGLFVIQMCKEAGIHVAVTASGNKMPDGMSKIEFVKSLGANEVVDYTTQDWSEVLAGQNFDQILDCIGDDADLAKASKVLKKGGSFVSIANFNPACASTDEVLDPPP